MLMTCLTIVVMALMTYLTRIAGYLVFRNIEMGQRTRQVMEAAPGCVLIAVIAPHFATGRLADMLALAITIAAASRFPLLVTVLAGVVSAGILRWLLPL
ncbi:MULTISPECIES: AzlD family protein [unclassified Zymobacter]|uniref:AzlD family protein n=1 Tax=unclassified Zymobacter TaxID=3048685 RepID=UPI0039C2D04A